MKSDLVDIAITLLHETPKAYLVDDGSGKKQWVPKSQCEYDPDTQTLTLPEWLAVEKEFI